ncbi:tetratricopeptide repeat protein [Ferruginibacter sp.]
MRTLALILTLLTFKLTAQVDLKFDKRFVESEDKWVAFGMDKDSSYIYGFIYIDEQAGLTFNREGKFKINSDHTFAVEKLKEANIKVRLQPNNVKVAWIPAAVYKDLQIESVPDWLKFYKTDTTSAKRLYKWGYMYNGWELCSKALTYLIRAKQIAPDYEGLNVELAFSYNCLGEYNNAEQILEEEIKVNPTNAYVNKEYIYTVTKTKNIDKATTQFLKSITTIKDRTYNAENCFNILQYFYIAKDKKNFNTWYNELKKWPNDNQALTDYANAWNKEINK